MKKALLFSLIAILAIGFLAFVGFHLYFHFQSRKYTRMLGPEPSMLSQGDYRYRDLNKNGRLDPYEDGRREVEERVSDLLSQMTLEEKAGLMFINLLSLNQDGSLLERPSFSDVISFANPSTSLLIAGKKMNHFNVAFLPDDPRVIARWNNQLQTLAGRTRLGIPVTLASDPRNAFGNSLGANLPSGSFSQWCEPIGLAASRDTLLAWQFADMVRQEYLAVGLRLALHPMADLATEPRWARINGTFGEDAQLSSAMLRAYIHGFQGDSLGPQSVACMSKHFPGGGPQKDGWDAHFSYGRDQAYPGDNFDYHLTPFEEGAFAAGTAQIMPYYGIPVGQTSEEVAFAFNKEIITGLLREHYGFEGVICSDWNLLTDNKFLGISIKDASGWGVDSLSPIERVETALDAGIDQFGGEQTPELIISLVQDGDVAESRVDQSVRRLLRDKFRLGLFDDPFVEEEKAAQIVGNKEFVEAGQRAQQKAMVLLKNEKRLLPLKEGLNIYVENIDPQLAGRYGKVVSRKEEADVALIRVATPFEKRTGGLIESMFHQGDMDFKEAERTHILKVAATLPTVVDIYLDRPAVIPEIAEACSGLLADFGASDESVLKIIFGRSRPEGRLPFELPSSMEAVREQKEDVPCDSEAPLFEFGVGLRY